MLSSSILLCSDLHAVHPTVPVYTVDWLSCAVVAHLVSVSASHSHILPVAAFIYLYYLSMPVSSLVASPASQWPSLFP